MMKSTISSNHNVFDIFEQDQVNYDFIEEENLYYYY